MRRAWILALALGAAGCGSLDSPDLVHDLRMLAMRSDPAEQVFALPFYADGGAVPSGDGGLSGAGLAGLASLSVQPITVTALVADPDGGGRPIHYQYAICPVLADAGRCDLSQPDSYALAEGDLVPDGGWGEVAVTFTPTLGLLTAAVEQDPYHGFDFLPVPVQLHITAGSEEVWGIKRLVFTLAFAGEPVPTPNQNPFIPLLLLDGDVWSDTVPPVLVDRRGYDITPLIPDGGLEAYQRPDFSGNEIAFTENWRYDFFATAGGYSSFGTGGQSSFSTVPTPVDSTWTPDDSDGPQPVTYFVVVRDGRGGEGWTVRQAEFAPTVGAK